MAALLALAPETLNPLALAMGSMSKRRSGGACGGVIIVDGKGNPVEPDDE